MAKDPQLWKRLYYFTFVHPQNERLSNSRNEKSFSDVGSPSKFSIWAGSNNSLASSWKCRYRLRHNWARGTCAVTKVKIGRRVSQKHRYLIQICGNVVITVSAMEGVQIWCLGDCKRLASRPLHDGYGLAGISPTSLSADQLTQRSNLALAIGFSDGRFELYQCGFDFMPANSSNNDQDGTSYTYQITLVQKYTASIPGSIAAISVSSIGYLASLSDAQQLSIFSFSWDVSKRNLRDDLRLLSSLKSDTSWPPLCLSVRSWFTGFVVSVAYAIPTYLSSWSVGVQEIQFTISGSISRSRIASAAHQGFVPLVHSLVRDHEQIHNQESVRGAPKPIALSYCHPYLLSSHPDNTLLLHLVHSSDSVLRIGPGRRLWGHTSSVSNVQVGARGKAVSVSAKGREIRIWELEKLSQKDGVVCRHGVELKPKQSMLTSMSMRNEDYVEFQGMVDFNDEHVLLVREEVEGSQQMIVHSFK